MKRLFRFAGFAFALATLSTHAAPADARSAPGSELFANAAIRRFKIEIAGSELEKLQRENRTYVRATVTVDGKVFKDVGVRLKGRGSFRPLNEKPSLALKFDEFVSNQQFHGLNRIMLNNSSQDSTYLSEYLGTSLFRDAGVPAARVTHARVDLNGRELGFYVLVEAMNKVFSSGTSRTPPAIFTKAMRRTSTAGSNWTKEPRVISPTCRLLWPRQGFQSASECLRCETS